ncbi:hypothetical protein ACIPSE_28905 [Streptomyces sp. NPDC090106]|uniref:hypothetical protein n=1 Tax=Streptomyces sp. NPDC090106 TaxID=3365946 RepID=UPI0037F4085F
MRTRPRPHPIREEAPLTAPFRLRPEDRPDFETVLHLALNTPDIRTVLTADPTGRASARLRLRALTDADEIAVAARDEYDTYVTLHASANETTAAHESDEGRTEGESSLLPALAVLTPAISGTSAAVLVVLGYLLRLADTQGSLAGSLITAGWILALIATVSTLTAVAALLVHAVRRHRGPGHPARLAQARLEQARMDWQQALLTRGMLPRLRHYLDAAPHRATAPDAQPPTGVS